jgi:hypothetical protein
MDLFGYKISFANILPKLMGKGGRTKNKKIRIAELQIDFLALKW